MVKAGKRITYSAVLSITNISGNAGIFGYRRKGLCEIKPSIYSFIYVFYAYR